MAPETKHGFAVGETVTGVPCTPMFGRDVKILGFTGYGLVDVSYDGVGGFVGAKSLRRR